MNNKHPDEHKANILAFFWRSNYGLRMAKFQQDMASMTELEKRGYEDLLYQTFPYLKRKQDD